MNLPRPFIGGKLSLAHLEELRKFVISLRPISTPTIGHDWTVGGVKSHAVRGPEVAAAEDFAFRVILKDDTHVTVGKGYTKAVGDPSYTLKDEVDLEVTGDGFVYIIYDGEWSEPLFSVAPPVSAVAVVYVLADITTEGEGDDFHIVSIFQRKLGDFKEPVCDLVVPEPCTTDDGSPGISLHYARRDHIHHQQDIIGDGIKKDQEQQGPPGYSASPVYDRWGQLLEKIYIKEIEVCENGQMITCKFLTLGYCGSS